MNKTPLSFPALTYRNFRLFWFGQLISLTGTWMHSAAQGWLVLKLTDSPFYLGLVGTAGSIPILLFTLAGGVAADRFNKRNIILSMQGILMFLAFTLAFLVTTEIVTIWHVLAIAFLIGTAHAFDIPARQSFFIELVGKKNLLNAIALNSAAFHGARMIGPAIAGAVIGYFGITVCFYINGLSFIAAIIGLLKMKFDEDITRRPRSKSVSKELMEGLNYIIGEPKVYKLIALVGILSFFGFPYMTFLPVYAKDILKTGASGLGILMGFAGAGAFAGAGTLAISEDISRKDILLVVAGIIFSTALLIFSLSETVWLSHVMLLLVGWGAVTQIATANSILQLTVPDSLRGRVMSSFTMVFLGMASLGNLAVGSLAHYLGTSTALMISASLCLFVSILILWRKMGQQPAVPDLSQS
jgi:MFS family permease